MTEGCIVLNRDGNVMQELEYNRRCDKRKRTENVHVKSVFAYDPNLFDLFKLEPDVLARQITLCDVDRFKCICTGELWSRGWEKKEAEKLKLVPNIYKFTTQFNQVSYWVAGEILKELTPKLRADKISYFLRMSKSLEELRNYHSLVAVVMGININAVFRLHNTWELVSKKEMSLFKSYVDLSAGNWKQLKEILDNTLPPAIPHLGVYLQQISGTFSHPKLPMTHKEEKAQKLIDSIEHFQSSKYDIQYINHIQDFLTSEKYILEMQRFMEENILKLSFEREPTSRSPATAVPVPSAAKHRRHKTPSRSLEDITLANPLHEISGEFNNPKNHGNKKSTFKPGHRKTHSLSMLEGFNTDQEKAGTALLLSSPTIERTFSNQCDQNLIDDSWARRNRSISEPPNCQVVSQISVTTLTKISEVRYEGLLMKKTCQRLGKQPKIRRWKTFYCLVSDGKLNLYHVKKHRTASGIGQSSVLKKSISLDHCTVSYDWKHSDIFTVADSVGNIYKFKGSETKSWVTKLLEEKDLKKDLLHWD